MIDVPYVEDPLPPHLRQQFKDCAGENGLYNLEPYFDALTINKRMEKAPKFKREPVVFEKYPLDKAHVNAL